MAFEDRFTGREEKRLPVIMEVELVSTKAANSETQEKAVLDNISALGARVYASRPWRLGEQVEVTAEVRQNPLRAEVVYCQKAEDGRFVVGLKFRRSPELWSILEKVKKRVP